MENFKSILVIAVIVAILYKEVSYFGKGMIFVKHTLFDYILIVCGGGILVALTVFFAKNIFDYVFAVLAIITFIMMWLKSSVSENGVLIVTHYGKDFYAWKEIQEIQVTKKNQFMQISWYDKEHVCIAKQLYTKSDFEKVSERVKAQKIEVIQ